RANHRTATAHRGCPRKSPSAPRRNGSELLSIVEDAPALRDTYRSKLRITRVRESRQVVPQKNVDSDALLVGADGLTRTMREQNSRRRPRLVTGILVDDGIERAADQETPRVLGQLVRDPDHFARAAQGLQRIGDAAVPGATAVDAAEIGVARQQRGRELPRALAVVAAFDHRQREQVRILAG